MAIFPGQSFVKPIEIPVENLEIGAFMKGIQAGTALPTPVTAVANAITGGIDEYNKQVETAQRQEINDIRIQEARRAQQLEPLRTDVERAELEARQLEYAKQIKLREQEGQLSAIFQSQDRDQIVQALTSGQYSEIFANNPRLHQRAVEVAAPLMTEQERNIYKISVEDEAEQKRIRDQLLGIEKVNREARSALETESQILPSILQGNPQYRNNLDVLLQDVRQENEGRFERDPSSGEYIRKGGKLQLNKEFGTDPLHKQINLVSKKTGKILARNVPEEVIQNINSYARSQDQLKKVGRAPVDSYILDIVNKVSNQKKIQERDIAKEQISKAEKTVSGNTDQIPLDTFRKELTKLPFAAKGGKISFSSNLEATSLAARSLNVAPESVNVPELAKVLDTYKPSSRRTIADMEEGAADVDLFIRETLTKDFQLRKDKLSSKYNDAEVKRRNDAVQAAKDAMKAYGNGDLNALQGVPPISTLAKAYSPLDLYLEDAAPRMRTRLETLSREALNESKRRATAKIRKEQAIAAATQLLRN